MGASVVPTPSTASTAVTDNYVLISSVTPTAASSTLSFTGISGYRKLLLRTLNPGLSSTSTITLTFNGDSGTNYSYQSVARSSTTGTASSVLNASAGTGLALPSIPSGGLIQNLIINDTNTTGVKTFAGWIAKGDGGNTVYPEINGMYFASAAITSVTLTVTTNTFAATGTVALYGVTT